jgi:hypothetical protein
LTDAEVCLPNSRGVFAFSLRSAAELRVIAEPVLDEIFGVKFGEVLDVAMLGRLMPILTDESAMRLAARAYKVRRTSSGPLQTGRSRPAGAREQH